MQRNTYYVWRCRLNGGKIPFFFFSKKSYPETCGRGLSVFLSKSLIVSVVYLHPRLSSIFQLLLLPRCFVSVVTAKDSGREGGRSDHRR